jgi:hypothetical protein
VALVVKDWQDSPSTTTPINAAALEDMETRVAAWGNPDTVTSLPASPTAGQVVFYEADATNGVIWQLKYRPASSSAYDWEFVGGSPLFAEVATDQGTTSASYVDLTTVGPSITVPLAGDYMIDIAAHAYNSGANVNLMSYAVGGTAASDNDAAEVDHSAANRLLPHAAGAKKTALAASTALVAKYRVTAGTGQFRRRQMRVVPVRVG